MDGQVDSAGRLNRVERHGLRRAIAACWSYASVPIGASHEQSSDQERTARRHLRGDAARCLASFFASTLAW